METHKTKLHRYDKELFNLFKEYYDNDEMGLEATIDSMKAYSYIKRKEVSKGKWNNQSFYEY